MSLSIQSVRDLLSKHGLSAVIIPTGDPHSSEYPCPHWELRKALCPFTGSAGCVVITSDKALLWTDSRYWEHPGSVKTFLAAVASASMPARTH